MLDAEDHLGDEAPLGACGQVSVDVTIKLVDEAGATVPAGQIGEIAVAGPMTHAGYLGARELDRDTRLPGGFIRTRDMGRFDERGFLHLVDRTSDMIVTGGYNVYPKEIEGIIDGEMYIVQRGKNTMKGTLDPSSDIISGKITWSSEQSVVDSTSMFLRSSPDSKPHGGTAKNFFKMKKIDL